jgi:hypothetical protein
MTGKLKQLRVSGFAADSGSATTTGPRLMLACVLVLAGGLCGCTSELTFDVPYDRAVTELRELYPKGGKMPERRQAALAGWDRVSHTSFGIKHEEPSPAHESVISLRATGAKLAWKRHVDITILRLSEARTSVTVHCDYLRTSLLGVGYSRSRDRAYERERLAEIRSRLEGQ